MVKQLKVGLIGTGNIAPAYIKGSRHFSEVIDVIACSDINMGKARAFADEHSLTAMTTEDLLASKDIDIVVNLTVPAVHAELTLAAIKAGKHVHSEKPLATTRADGERLVTAAREHGVRLGCAPDTFMGGGLQTALKLLNDGAIGEPIAAVAFFTSRGPESWHPNPTFFYQFGGGPLFDLGPYYLTSLIALLGPVRRVSATARASFKERLAGTGDMLKVDVNTHFSGSLDFASGAIATVITSFDVWASNLPRIEIYGSDGSLSVPDPNTFGGKVRLFTSQRDAWEDIPLTHSAQVGRGVAVADMAYAIQSGRPHRANGDLAYHVLDMMEAFDASSNSGTHIALTSACERPAPLPTGLAEGTLDP